MTTRKIRVTTRPVADNYTAANERTIEYSSPTGGGLITLSLTDDGKLIVDLHGHDATVDIRVGKPRGQS